ncbi:hypothetical protein SADUNF_Sadunf08G0050200 [Salix dunnii]|uniref:Uncharacterized protein n=1 Tax=Salix dunnii TaxID=1413687 RepID=A0A835JVR8_9ROSI|nr:hypothetical protein SADUNF_Sadunf08G0050200 [Salix dunnii]
MDSFRYAEVATRCIRAILIFRAPRLDWQATMYVHQEIRYAMGDLEFQKLARKSIHARLKLF